MVQIPQSLGVYIPLIKHFVKTDYMDCMTIQYHHYSSSVGKKISYPSKYGPCMNTVKCKVLRGSIMSHFVKKF